MKKIILLLGILFVTSTVAQAACEYNCVEPYDLNNKFRTFVGAVSGVNTIVENVAEGMLTKEVFKVASADDLKVDLKSRSAKDLKNGIFKSFELSGKNVLVNDIHLVSLDLKTLCDFNYVKQTDNGVVFVEDMPMSFDVVMDQDSINKSLTHPRYRQVIDDFNKIAASYALGFRVNSTKVAIKANKFYFIVGMNIPHVRKEQKVVFESDLRVKNGKFDLSQTKLVSGKLRLDVKKIDFLMNYLNPLEYSVKFLDGHNAKVNVKNMNIDENVLYVDGIVILPKN